MNPIPTAKAYRWNLALIALGTAAPALDTMVSVAFPAIGRAFDVPIVDIQWLVITYVLTYASLMLGFGRIGDIFGHRRLFRVGSLWGAGAYVLAAAAPSYRWLLAARVAQGLGTALVLASGPALITSLRDERTRPQLLGLYTMMFAGSAALGPLLGGALIKIGGWRMAFGSRAPMALIVALLGRHLPAPTHRPVTERFDAAGALLLAAALVCALLALNRVPLLFDGDWAALALSTAAIFCFVGFLRQERVASAPVIKLRPFRDPVFAGFSAASVIINLAGFTPLLLGPYYLVRAAGLSIAVAGAVLASLPLGTATASPICGRLLGRIAGERLALIGAAALGLGLALAILWGSSPFLPILAPTLFLQGFGLGLFQVAYLDVTVATLPREQRGVAGSLAMMTRTLGIVAGATLLTLSFHGIEALARRAGARPTIAFLIGIRGTFLGAALLSLIVVLVAGIAATAERHGRLKRGQWPDR